MSVGSGSLLKRFVVGVGASGVSALSARIGRTSRYYGTG